MILTVLGIASYPNFVFPRDEKAIACESVSGVSYSYLRVPDCRQVLWGLAANEAGKEGQEHIAAELCECLGMSLG